MTVIHVLWPSIDCVTYCKNSIYLIRKEKYVYVRIRSCDDRFSLVEYDFHRRAFQHDVRLQ